MTKQLLIIAFAGLSSTMAYAADLYVRNSGTGGAYSTVSAAITAASDGDKIIIQPKTNGDPYIENLIINKSLTFVSETNFSRYFIKGTITINPAAGRVVSISNLTSGNYTINDVTVSGATAGGRTTINLWNCDLNNVYANQSNVTTNISGCTVRGALNFSHGRATANKAQFITVRSSSNVQESYMATSDVEVFGNIVDDVLSYTQPFYDFKFYNNFSGRLSVHGIKNGGSNEIINNSIYSTVSGDVAPIWISLNSSTGTGNIAIMNNAISFVVGQTNACIQTYSNNVNITASYNVSTNPFITEGTMNQSNNSGSVNMNFNNTTYTLTGMNVNAGSPDVNYTDLDLTRNDAGHYGGSNSWANYWPANVGTRPQINYLVTPRSINGGTLNINGSGFSK
ncbi:MULTISPECIES: hypothetical protein [unclassified Chryseobacterium]|uniref:hypothetical protein n=1 Tax=unclassified Chryseobacterium TaxID=2593645 RepID=UPI00100B7D59|nr:MULTISPECIES: hypothetical protein [unclassified Chryseobacterium]